MALHEINYVFVGISIIVYTILSIKICRNIVYLFMLLKEKTEKEKIYIYPFNLKSDLKNALFNFQDLILFVILASMLFFYPKDFLRECRELLLPIFISIAIWNFSTRPDKNEILEINNLQIGHGAAIAYYKNYLELTLTERFSERIDKFRSENMIKITKKLFILVPRTCRVDKYLDEVENENIERCRELEEEEINHSGIKNRIYNITIYNVNGIRMAVEFAQPLKALSLFKEKGLFTMDEMLCERKIFAQTLKKFQKEDPFKYFVIVEYDDSVDKICRVLTNSYINVSENCYDS